MSALQPLMLSSEAEQCALHVILACALLQACTTLFALRAYGSLFSSPLLPALPPPPPPAPPRRLPF